MGPPSGGWDESSFPLRLLHCAQVISKMGGNGECHLGNILNFPLAVSIVRCSGGSQTICSILDHFSSSPSRRGTPGILFLEYCTHSKHTAYTADQTHMQCAAFNPSGQLSLAPRPGMRSLQDFDDCLTRCCCQLKSRASCTLKGSWTSLC